jgi:thioesterase domain-containing protein
VGALNVDDHEPARYQDALAARGTGRLGDSNVTMTHPAAGLAPITAQHETIVADIWHRILGGKASSDGMRLIDMSIGAGRVYRLLEEIEKETGVALPFTVAFQAPTLKALTEVVRRRSLPPFEPQVLIKNGIDTAPPLIILPGLGGSVLQLIDLARTVSHPGKTYISQQQGLSGDTPPHKTIDAMVDFQLDAVRAIQSSGPYYLVGYSLGGSVALEMARRLTACGETVGFIGMIEPGLPETLWPVTVRIGFVFKRVKHHWRIFRNQSSAREAIGYIAARITPLVGRVGRLLGTDAGGWSPYRAEGLPPALHALREANLTAIYAYRLQPFAEPVTFYQSTTGDPLVCDPLKVWPRYLSNLRVRTVPGGHETMLRGKNAKVLAARISEDLTSACTSNA